MAFRYGRFCRQNSGAHSRNKFLPAFLPLVSDVARLGAINSLSQTLLKLTSPGVPDIYQGNEIWDFSLVDPDNRRPVDYLVRRSILDTLAEVKPEELMTGWPDGRIKLFLTQRVLQFRREHPELFEKGNYLPLTVTGSFAECAVSFARQLDANWIVVVAPRLTTRFGFPPLGQVWQDTAVELPGELGSSRARNIFSSAELPIRDGKLALKDAFASLPFAAITSL